ncbi:MAG: hypothetical protein JF612_01710 [Planctomycetia bacterium]|nr:hypothetical protein [Planctomycetia bacterium]
MRLSLAARTALVILAAYASFEAIAVAPAADSLPNTAPLDWPEEDLSGRMMEGAHRFVERKIAEAITSRNELWKLNVSRHRLTSEEANPGLLRIAIGAVDNRLADSRPDLFLRMERFGDDTSPALVAETTLYRVYQVRWPVIEGVDGEGLLIEPKEAIQARIVAIPDADQTPEQIMGLAAGVPLEQQFARRLAESGCQLVIPTLVNRQPYATDDPQILLSTPER